VDSIEENESTLSPEEKKTSSEEFVLPKKQPEEKEEILDLWRSRLPALNLPKF
jgi:hypothetical protein